METYRLSHRARIEACLNGEPVDRPPVALWRHFPVDDQMPDSLAAATVAFQQTYDFDLVKVTPASSFCLRDWGVEDEWRGATEGTREYTRRRIRTAEDWLHLDILDPYRGHLADQITCLNLICKAIGEDTPIIQTIFSPLAQAKNLAGGQALLTHLRQFPDAVQTGLQIIAESTRLFIEAAIKTGIAGIFYAVQHANYHLVSEVEYQDFGERFDRQVLEPVKVCPLNMLHLHGENVMFNKFVDYPIQIINWHDQDTPPSLADASQRTNMALCGGLRREKTMVLGTPEQVLVEAHDSILAVKGKKFILGTGCVLPITVPRVNILAARKSVELIVGE